jgi:hypothetical protein
MSVQRSLSAQKLKYSTFIVERDYLDHSAAEWMYQMEIGGDDGLTEEVRYRQRQETASQQTDAIVGSSRTDNAMTPSGEMNSSSGGHSKPIQREHIYMSPAEYGAFYNQKQETLPDETDEGLKVPTGLLGEAFPEGLYLCYAGKTLVRVKPMNIYRRWSVVLYGKRPGSARGKGLQAAITMQDIINDDFNQSYAIKMTVARPLTIINRQATKELPSAGQFLFIDKLPKDVTNINGAVAQIPGQTIAQDGIGAWVEGQMQFILGTYSLQGSVGAPDAKVAGTATGAAMMNENASGRMIGPINQEIAADKELMFQILENIRDFSQPEQKKDLAKRFGPDVAEGFFTCNFRKTMSIGISKNTDAPRSQALTQANTMAFGQIAGQLAQAPWGGEVLSTIADVLGIPYNIGPGRSDRREAEYRLNKLALYEERMEQKNPALLADIPKAADKMMTLLDEHCAPLIDPFLHDHAAFADVYKDWTFGEASKTASGARRLVVYQLWKLHFFAQQEQQFKLAAHMKELEARTQGPPPDPDEVAEQAVAGKLVDQQIEGQAKDAELQRKLIEKHADAQMDQNGNGEQVEIVS